VSQKNDIPAAARILLESSILPESVLSKPHKEPALKKTPPNIPYSSGTPIGNEPSKFTDVKNLPPRGSRYVLSNGPIPWFLNPLSLSET
jgi:hypothetical protein